jgi:hypothetical protein
VLRAWASKFVIFFTKTQKLPEFNGTIAGILLQLALVTGGRLGRIKKRNMQLLRE